MRLLQKLTAVLEILIRSHPAALKILTGEHEPPTIREIAEMIGCLNQKNWLEILGCRIDTSNQHGAMEEQMYTVAETFLDVIELAGGWDHLNQMVHIYIRHNRTYWMVFRDYLAWMDKISTSRKGYLWQSDILSKKYGYSKNHLNKIRKKVPRDLAKLTVCFDVEVKV